MPLVLRLTEGLGAARKRHWAARPQADEEAQLVERHEVRWRELSEGTAGCVPQNLLNNAKNAASATEPKKNRARRNNFDFLLATRA